MIKHFNIRCDLIQGKQRVRCTLNGIIHWSRNLKTWKAEAKIKQTERNKVALWVMLSTPVTVLSLGQAYISQWSYGLTKGYIHLELVSTGEFKKL